MLILIGGLVLLEAVVVTTLALELRRERRAVQADRARLARAMSRSEW